MTRQLTIILFTLNRIILSLSQTLKQGYSKQALPLNPHLCGIQQFPATLLNNINVLPYVIAAVQSLYIKANKRRLQALAQAQSIKAEPT
jgi:hypothetical protein